MTFEVLLGAYSYVTILSALLVPAKVGWAPSYSYTNKINVVKDYLANSKESIK